MITPTIIAIALYILGVAVFFMLSIRTPGVDSWFAVISTTVLWPLSAIILIAMTIYYLFKTAAMEKRE